MTLENHGPSTSTPAAGADGDIAVKLWERIQRHETLRGGGTMGVEERMLREARAEIVRLREHASESKTMSVHDPRWTAEVESSVSAARDIGPHGFDDKNCPTFYDGCNCPSPSPTSSDRAIEPDGYAVLLDDANVAGTPGGCGYWYVGAYRTEVVAKDVAARGKQGARVVPMYFSPQSATRTIKLEKLRNLLWRMANKPSDAEPTATDLILWHGYRAKEALKEFDAIMALPDRGTVD